MPRPHFRVPIDRAVFEAVHATLSVREDAFVARGVAELAAFGAEGVPFVLDSSADAVGLVKAPVNRGAVEVLATADAVRVHDFVGGGIPNVGGFVAVAGPGREEVVDHGVRAALRGPVDRSVDKLGPLTDSVGVGQLARFREQRKIFGPPRALYLSRIAPHTSYGAGQYT